MMMMMMMAFALTFGFCSSSEDEWITRKSSNSMIPEKMFHLGIIIR